MGSFYTCCNTDSYPCQLSGVKLACMESIKLSILGFDDSALVAAQVLTLLMAAEKSLLYT